MARRERRTPMGDNVTSVVELADKLYKKAKYYNEICCPEAYESAMVLAQVCANAADAMLPLSVVKQLLKGTNYEQYI